MPQMPSRHGLSKRHIALKSETISEGGSTVVLSSTMLDHTRGFVFLVLISTDFLQQLHFHPRPSSGRPMASSALTVSGIEEAALSCPSSGGTVAAIVRKRSSTLCPVFALVSRKATLCVRASASPSAVVTSLCACRSALFPTSTLQQADPFSFCASLIHAVACSNDCRKEIE
eukprot:m.160289 g.160289  ORF g.160289 m.160289 type:complete len:172 (+) comp14550_c1_seq3:1723-2238(+)